MKRTGLIVTAAATAAAVAGAVWVWRNQGEIATRRPLNEWTFTHMYSILPTDPVFARAGLAWKQDPRSLADPSIVTPASQQARDPHHSSRGSSRTRTTRPRDQSGRNRARSASSRMRSFGNARYRTFVSKKAGNLTQCQVPSCAVPRSNCRPESSHRGWHDSTRGEHHCVRFGISTGR